MSAVDAAKIAELSRWVTGSYPPKVQADFEKTMWRRIGKAVEEIGEVQEAWYGVLGENPRKGTTHVMTDVVEELLDVALAALGAVEECTGNQGLSGPLLTRKIDRVHERAGLA